MYYTRGAGGWGLGMCTKFWLKKVKKKRPLRRPSHTIMNKIKMNLKVTEWEDVNWIHVMSHLNAP
jgi:hypothetical protein